MKRATVLVAGMVFSWSVPAPFWTAASGPDARNRTAQVGEPE